MLSNGLLKKDYAKESPLMTMEEAESFFKLSDDNLTEKQQRKKIINWKTRKYLPENIFCRLGKPLYIVKSKLKAFILGELQFKFKTVTLLTALEMADLLDIPTTLPDRIRENRVLSLLYNKHLPKTITFKVGDSLYFVKEKFDAYINQ